MTTSDDVATGWNLLEQGDLDGARRAYERALARTPEDPDVISLCGAIASVSGNAEEALQAFLRAAEHDPDNTRHLVHAAEIYLMGFDDPDSALALCDRILDATTEEEDLIDAVILKAEALVSLGDSDDEARETLTELEGCAMDDPMLLCRTADLHLTLGDMAAAERAYAAAIELDGEWADAHHGLGLVCEARGDTARAVDAWLRTRELDLALPDPPWHLSLDEFEKVAERALEELPEEVRERLANVPVLIDDAPTEDQVRSGIDPRLLGLFMGVPLPHKSHLTDGQVPHIDTVHLFQRNLERASQSPEHLHEEIRVTVLHETAHFFGLEDDDLDEIGLG